MQRKQRFDPTHFRVIVYQPDEAFYQAPFKQRLEILLQNIGYADQLIKENEPDAKVIFVAPEYLFKDFSQEGEKRYYSSKEKKDYLTALQKASHETDMILAPGTICWKKENENGSVRFTNMMYLFHHGDIYKYKKKNPIEWYDFDFANNDASVTKEDKAKRFRDGAKDESIKEINGINIGIEICSDNGAKCLAKKIAEDPDRQVDVHLIVADGLAENILDQTNHAMVKVDRNRRIGDKVGTVYEGFQNRFFKDYYSVEEADAFETGKDELTYYKFKPNNG
jgi:predicted amidohydrolase